MDSLKGTKMKNNKAGDEHLGAFVYCRQHVGPHSTGWCTVSADDKIPLNAKNIEEAYAECKTKDWRVYLGDAGYSGNINP
jgi:hypothetical protein